MIEFDGHISDKFLLEVRNREKWYQYKMWCIFAIISIMGALAVGLILKIWWGFILAGISIIPVIIIPFSKLRVNSKFTGKTKLSINSEEIIQRCQGSEVKVGIIDKTTVVDYGKYYVIADVFVAQKDLLVEGTIEDFEKIFEGRIVCKDCN